MAKNTKNTAPIEEAVATPEVKVEEKVTKKIGTVVDCGNLRVRKAPNFDGDVLTEIAAGTEVTILKEAGADWLNVALTDGLKGFVCAQYVSIK